MVKGVSADVLKIFSRDPSLVARGVGPFAEKELKTIVRGRFDPVCLGSEFDKL